MVQLHTSGRYNIRRNVTKSERYKNGTVHDFSLWRNAKCSVQWCVAYSLHITRSIVNTQALSTTVKGVNLWMKFLNILSISVSVLYRNDVPSTQFSPSFPPRALINTGGMFMFSLICNTKGNRFLYCVCTQIQNTFCTTKHSANRVGCHRVMSVIE